MEGTDVEREPRRIAADLVERDEPALRPSPQVEIDLGSDAHGTTTRMIQRLEAGYDHVSEANHDDGSIVSKGKHRHRGVLRRLLWTGFSASLTALAAVAARRVATKIWLKSTGTPPPVES